MNFFNINYADGFLSYWRIFLSHESNRFAFIKFTIFTTSCTTLLSSSPVVFDIKASRWKKQRVLTIEGFCHLRYETKTFNSTCHCAFVQSQNIIHSSKKELASQWILKLPFPVVISSSFWQNNKSSIVSFTFTNLIIQSYIHALINFQCKYFSNWLFWKNISFNSCGNITNSSVNHMCDDLFFQLSRRL